MVKLLLDRYANVAVMDVLAVKQASKFAKDAVANGPIVLEMDTYRYHGHSMSDQGGTYRTRDEISGVRQERDPVERVRKLILAHNLATPELKDMEKEIRKQVDAIAKAKESSMPDTSELFINVYKKDFSVEERDRIERIRKLIYAHDLATPAELKDMEKEIRKQVDDAIAKEKESSMPDTSVLFTNGHQNGCGVEPPAEIDLVERRCRTLMSRRNDIDFMENASYKFYKGPIFNTVTCSLDGSNEEVSYSHLCATGHHRLWHFINGMILDTSSLFGPGRVLYTTAERGTFYLKYTYRNHEVTLPIDGRLGWDFGIQNKFGTFEFAHGCKNMYLDLYDNWKMLQGFPGDYSVKGISPNGLESTPMGITAARYACEILSEYKGELPAPEVVRECCSVLMQYGPEALKFNVVLDKTVPSLSQNGELPSMPMTLNSLSPALAPVERRWSNFGGVGLQTCMWKLKYPHVETEAKLRGIPGVVTTVDQALDAVNVIPYNRIPFPGGRKRTWKAFGLDRDAYLAGGRPHVLSPEFARPWPYNEKLVRNIPDEKFYQGWEEFTVHRIY
ncbi:unnamed protein product [Urochloa humidicola]